MGHFCANLGDDAIFEPTYVSIAHFLSNLGNYAIKEENKLSMHLLSKTLEKTYPHHNKCDEDRN